MHSKLTRALLAIAALAVLLCPLQKALAQADAKAGEKKKDKLLLKLWRLPDPRSTQPPTLAELEVVKTFRENNPTIDLTSFTGISIEGTGMDSQVLMAIAGGQSPDIMNVNFRQSESYIGQGFLYPLDEYLEERMEELEARVPDPVRPVVYRKGPDGEEHWYAVPRSISVRALMYRKDLFREVGLDPNRPPRTWKEMEEYAERLTRPEKGTYGLMFTMGPYASWDWMTFLWSAGGEAVAKDEKGQWRAVFDSDEAVEAMLFYVHLNCREWTDSSGKTQRGYTYREAGGYQKWHRGEIGMVWANLSEGTIAGSEGIDPDLIELAPVPKGPTGLRGTELNASMMGIFSDIQPRGGHSAEDIRKAAFKYIWFYGSDEANAIRTKVLVEHGYGKFVDPSWLKKFGYEEYLKFVPQDWVDLLDQAIKEGKPEPYGKNCQLVYNFMSVPMQECVDLEYRGKLGKTDDERRKKIKKILEHHVSVTNEQMIGVVSPEERRKRNNIALVVAICMLSGFLLVLRRVWNIFTPKKDIGIPKKGTWQFWRYRWAYIILIPAMGSVLLWNYYPMARGTIMAFQDYRVVGESKWVGLQNLADVLWDPVWWNSLLRTLYYMTLFLGLGFCTPIILALLLSEVSHGKILYRTIYYLPAVLTGVVVIYMWKLFFDPSETGLLNLLLAQVGLGKVRWLENANVAMWCCVIPTVWAGMGPGCLIYLAALKAVPEDLYEAADLDGCGFFKKIWYITVPTIKGLIIINFIGAFIGASQTSGFILIMTYGGPGKATWVAGLHIFDTAYMMLKFGTAVTMAWMLGVLMLGFTTIQLKRLSRMEFTTADSRKARQQ